MWTGPQAGMVFLISTQGRSQDLKSKGAIVPVENLLLKYYIEIFSKKFKENFRENLLNFFWKIEKSFNQIYIKFVLIPLKY